MDYSKKNINLLLKKVADFGLSNLKNIESLNINLNNEIESFYIGYIYRQFNLLSDLNTLLKDKEDNFYGSQFILFRCIIDDFIHLTYIINQPNSEDLIINFNADAYSKNFNKLMELAEFNDNQLGGNYPNYPTNQQINQLRDQFNQNPSNQQYFSDIHTFKFKSFKTTGNLIRELNGEPYSHKLIRAYFLWRRYSDFVHYSNFSFSLERKINPTQDSTFTEFSEIIHYSYRVILNSALYFKTKYNLEIIDNDQLSEYYKDAEH